MTKFLLATDGSMHAQVASRFLADWALDTNLVTVFSTKKACKGQEETVELFRQKGFEEPVTIVDDCDPRSGIIKAADDHDSDCIVLGSRGQGALARAFGSVSTDVLHRSKRPVLIVHHEQLTQVRSFCVAVDGSKGADKALEFLAKKILRAGDLVVVYAASLMPELVYVAGKGSHVNPHYKEQLQTQKDKATKCVTMAAEALNNTVEGLTVLTHVDMLHDTRDNIIKFAEGHNLQTIVCGAQGLNTAERILLGSFSTNVATNARNSAVLVVP
eukprot:NODE_2862_length_980_cov_24.568581_g2842_i0.p1 GENE.NODE_2862_length_980_cov_24.568581_g2842_i0~~NODE_2862_length_980_cov_24.568581_g2842_i0.p1  ORF type:complete len:272 (-),score=62.47 NODE_2862_length_980_cov_24.568581_g2842_i0:107-922(-)